MRVQSLQLSNILSFKHEDSIEDAFKITFDPALSILIGGNGSGKSTALEAINFIFGRVLLKSYILDNNHFNDARLEQKKSALRLWDQEGKVSPFRLQPNWKTESERQAIKITLTLDDIDKSNIQSVADNHSALKDIIGKYSHETLPNFSSINGDESTELTATFTGYDDSFAVSYGTATEEHIKFYLEKYELLNEAITIHNEANGRPIDTFNTTFSMLSAFRNYTTFTLNTSVQSDPREQFRNIRAQESGQSNHQQQGEPSIFNKVKLHLGECHQKLTINKRLTSNDATKQVNDMPLVKKINEKLEILNLNFSVRCTNPRNWSYEFKFYDTKHERDLGDINSLSAGQKSIIHLIFEAYGQDNTKGGVVIVDEPEIHLHYQFQFEYLRIIKELIADKKTQYILVTHSEGFIGSKTAAYIKRFALNEHRNSIVCAPLLTTSQKKLIEILDNTRAGSALFANKVVLVEGQDDEYFFRAALKSYKPELSQEIAVYNTHSKNSISSWKKFFELFGVRVYFIKDLDAVGKDFYSEPVTFEPNKQGSTTIADFKNRHSDLISKIEAEYENAAFYLKAGAIEQYTQMSKGIEFVIEFCETMSSFLLDGSDNSKEIIKIINTIVEK